LVGGGEVKRRLPIARINFRARRNGRNRVLKGQIYDHKAFPMTHATVAALTILILTACSPQFMRYDLKEADASPVYRPTGVGDQQYAAGFEAIRAQDYAGAEAPLMRHLGTNQDDPYALLAMGAVMEQTGRPGDAVTYYRRAALYGETAPLGEVLSFDSISGPMPRTIREAALMNMTRLR